MKIYRNKYYQKNTLTNTSENQLVERLKSMKKELPQN